MTSPHKEKTRILVIKLSALGDFIQALGAMQAIRMHHKNAHITLLTTNAYSKLAQASGYFDEILMDSRPKMYQLGKILRFRKALNSKKFDRIYDLQNNDRTGFYFRLFYPKPEWVGIAAGASHRNTSKERTSGLAFHGHKQTLALAGIDNVKIDTLLWMDGNVQGFELPEKYALIIPGSAPQHPYKRWGSDNYAWLCNQLLAQGIRPVLIGAQAEEAIGNEITQLSADTYNLIGKTDLFDLPALARNCVFAIGNDTGPMHFIGPTGAQTYVLFTKHSNPTRHRPLGENVHALSISDYSRQSIWDQVLQSL